MQTSPPLPATLPAARRKSSARWLLLLLIIAILLQLLLHLLLGVDFLFKNSVADRSIALLHWQTLDQSIGWIALIIFLFANPHAPADRHLIATRLLRRAAAVALAAGIVILACRAALQQSGIEALSFSGMPGGQTTPWTTLNPLLEQTLAVLLGLAASLLCLDQLAALSRNLGHAGGLTLEQLWRLVTIQWILVWTAAEIFLRFKWAHKGGLSDIGSDNLAKHLLFALPTFALLPNLFMALGLRWLPLAIPSPATPGKPTQRTRGLLIAMIAVNVAAICLTLGGLDFRWLAILGIIPLAFAILMYLTAFRAATWRGSGRLVAFALALLFLGALLFAGERLKATQEISLWREYTAGWRFLLGYGVPLIWLVGMGGIALRALVPKRLQSDLALSLAASLIVLGTLSTVFTLAMAGLVNHDWLTGVFFGCVLLLLGGIIGCAAIVRTKPWRFAGENPKTADSQEYSTTKTPRH